MKLADSHTPLKIEFTEDRFSQIRDVACGMKHTAFISSNFANIEFIQLLEKYIAAEMENMDNWGMDS